MNWNSNNYFSRLTKQNKLAQQHGFEFCTVSGLEGLEEALDQMQTVQNFVCVQDTNDGYTIVNNTPRTRRVKTIFLLMRYPVNDMAARADRMQTMQELFRQFASHLLREKQRLQEQFVYLDERITFNEVDQYFLSGAACTYFQIAVDVPTDLQFNQNEWTND